MIVTNRVESSKNRFWLPNPVWMGMTGAVGFGNLERKIISLLDGNKLVAEPCSDGNEAQNRVRQLLNNQTALNRAENDFLEIYKNISEVNSRSIQGRLGSATSASLKCEPRSIRFGVAEPVPAVQGSSMGSATERSVGISES